MPEQNPLKGAKAGERYVLTTPQGATTLVAIIDLHGEDEPWVAMDHCAYGPVSTFPQPGSAFSGGTFKKVWPEDD